MNQLTDQRRNILLIIMVILLVANLLIAMALLYRMNKHIPAPSDSSPDACLVLPRQFIYQHPDCANTLLEFMNITNVKIYPRDSIGTFATPTS